MLTEMNIAQQDAAYSQNTQWIMDGSSHTQPRARDTSLIASGYTPLWVLNPESANRKT